MDEDTIIGAAKQVDGRIERAAGTLAGDTGTELHGAVREFGGAAQQAFGEAKDEIRETAGHLAIPQILAGMAVGLTLGLFLNRH